MYFKPPLVLTSVALAATGPVLLHGHPERDCIPSFELCPASLLFSAPDEPAPKNEPGTIFAPLVVSFTGSSVSTWLGPYRIIST